jgi:hypothetical protein
MVMQHLSWATQIAQPNCSCLLKGKEAHWKKIALPLNSKLFKHSPSTYSIVFGLIMDQQRLNAGGSV